MTQIDTSTEAVEDMKSEIMMLEMNGENWVTAHDYLVLLAERDALKLRAEQAEAREAALLANNEEARQFLRQRDALKAEITNMRAERNHANDVADAAIDEVERLRVQADAVWNEALGGAEKAAASVAGADRDHERGYRRGAGHVQALIRSLKRPVKGESYE